MKINFTFKVAIKINRENQVQSAGGDDEVSFIGKEDKHHFYLKCNHKVYC